MADSPSPHEILNLVRKELGDDAAARLIWAAGGTIVSVPRIKGPVLVKRLGEELARFLIQHWGGEKIELPSRRAFATRTAILNSSEPSNSLARKLGVSRRWVIKVRKQARQSADRRQQDLFK